MPPAPHPGSLRHPALVFTLLLALIGGGLLAGGRAARAEGVLVSQGKPTIASSVENAVMVAAAATDGDLGTRWSSQAADAQWLQVDLGAPVTVDRITLHWEAAYATRFRIEFSTDGSAWTSPHTGAGTPGVQNLAVAGVARYVRWVGLSRATGYGYSLWEFQVYGAAPSANIAAYAQVSASSHEGGNAPAAALDGRLGTRWSSQFGNDHEWLRIDFGGRAQLTGVVLHWEGAYAKAHRLELSDDGNAWRPLHSTAEGTGGVERISAAGSGRYLRWTGVTRATGYGYSLWELQVLGTVDNTASTPPLLSPPTRPPGGPARFALHTPGDQAMITDTRRPEFRWAAVPGATRYELWLNVSRADYDYTAPGNLLDLHTKVAETTTPNYTPAWDIPDRWTYRWHVLAVTGGGTQVSATHTFSLYRPALETVADGIGLIGGSRDLNRDGAIQPYENWRLPVQARVDDLLGRMTTEEKAYQLFYNAQRFPNSGWHFGPADAQDLHNTLLAAGGTRLGIPFVTAGDTVSGYQTTYPTQSGLAAAGNHLLTHRLGDMQRREQLEVGARGTLGPIAEVGTKVLYPRIQEGNGEDAQVAAAQVRALVSGLQGGPELNPNSVLATVKHWPGEGAGGEALIVYDGVTIKYHLIPFRAALEAGAVNIMPGYAGSSFLDPGGPGAGDSAKILAYLRRELGYTGLITTDWLPSGSWVGAANAGSDVMGGADPGAPGYSIGQFIAGVPLARIDDAVRRVLSLKFRLGIFEAPYGDPVNGPYRFHQPGHVQLANQAAREALTLLRNDGVLPLRLTRGDNIVVAGPRADDEAACCIWTSFFHEEYGSQTMLAAIRARAEAAGVTVHLDTAPNPRLAVVAVGETSYTHGTNWVKEQPFLPPDQLALIQDFRRRGIPVVVALVMPRPYVITEWQDQVGAIVLTYRGGEEMGPALASLLFGDFQPSGKLPWQLPRLLSDVLRPGGQDILEDANEAWDLPYDLGATPAQRAEIRAHIDAGRPVPPVYGNPLYQFGSGRTGW
ncbi:MULTISPECIES: discoidin domain-containing protein [unclassified Crossiella]|uniref:discoidin domain-containing protein n=1 Tax=unclassified Crossiella TaxID=2620835 RepID=UPI001FFE4878|nr:MULTISPECIES: discoidin domain-containing protein [unclassified Crossiella]MCK2238509.1 discoidin domain-containing protein [Crossiella sp. S99.2]MCK2251921.1 discoidin domain-containing protein [Crossiella sp. S99.1]